MELEKLGTRYTALAPDRFAKFLEGLKSGGSYRYGDTSVSPGSTKSGVFLVRRATPSI
jgi:hypothetical protein